MRRMIKIKEVHNASQQQSFFCTDTFVVKAFNMRFKIAVLIAFTCSHVFSQTRFETANFSMVIKGTSNLHDWESSVRELKADGLLRIDATGVQAIQSLTVEIPVRAIRSTKGSVMDNKTYDAFNAKEHPFITYKLEQATLNRKGDIYDVAASGKLTMAGVTNKIDLNVRGKSEDDGSLTFSGSRKLKLSDFQMKRPSALMGTITVGDEVEVIFRLTLRPIR